MQTITITRLEHMDGLDARIRLKRQLHSKRPMPLSIRTKLSAYLAHLEWCGAEYAAGKPIPMAAFEWYGWIVENV